MDKLNKDILKIIEQAFDLTDKEHKEIIKLYKQSKDNIQQFLASLYLEYGIDGVISYDDYLRHHAVELEQLIIDEAKRIANNETILMATILELALNHTYNKTAYHIEQDLKVGINFKLLRPEFIENTINYNWSGIPFSERIWGNTEHLVKSLRQELAQGLKAGESVDKIAKRINKQFNRKVYESQRLIRTESARVINKATEQIYQAIGVKEIIFSATLDNRTSDICRGLDGKKFRLDDENKPEIPQHPNCRSCYIPVPFDDYKPEARKDNESKEIIDYMSYKDWQKLKGITS